MFPSAAPKDPQLVWWPEAGMGFYPVDQQLGVYDDAYWHKYIGYDASPLGRDLSRARVEFVNRSWRGPLIDVGIGAGGFIDERNHALSLPDLPQSTFGWDVNPHALAWLEARGLLRDPAQPHPRMALSFWDCLEHIPEPDAMLQVACMVFVSLPLFDGPEHVMRSKHFRRDEHCWYWTRAGLIRWFAARGFQCWEHHTQESLLGREDIHSFAFSKVARR